MTPRRANLKQLREARATRLRRLTNPSPEEISAQVRLLRARKRAKDLAEREAKASASGRLLRKYPMTQCRAHRKLRGLTQTGLAEACGVLQGDISALEMGEAVRPRISELVASYLGIPAADLQSPEGVIEVPPDVDPMDDPTGFSSSVTKKSRG